MRVLFVASYNKGHYAPFILEQAAALKHAGCEIEFFGITGKGVKGYLKALPQLKKAINGFHPDLIHAHYGLSGLLANLQRGIPVVTTYHGSDINDKTVLPFSCIAMRLSRFNIFVSQRTLEIARPGKNYALIPCGIDLNELQLIERLVARERMGLDAEKKFVLFSGAFDNPVKNYPLAKAVMELITDAELLELKGYSRKQVTLLMCAVDAFLMTSYTEGSPQVIKEAMACGLPVVSVDVGDVAELTNGISGCYISDREPEDLAISLREAIYHGPTTGRQRIIERGLTNAEVAETIIGIYKSLI